MSNSTQKISFGYDEETQDCLFQQNITLSELSKSCPSYIGTALSKFGISEEVKSHLNEIFSMASPNERYFLYNFFKHVWDGQGEVMEIGSYLGSTTRAIMSGIVENPRAQNPSFTTVDRFNCPSVRTYLQEFLKAHDLYHGSADSKNDIETQNDWYQLFQEIHLKSPGSDFLNIVRATLPDETTDPFPPTLEAEINKSEGISVLFVDGFKSWFAMKMTMKKIVSKLNKGAYVIFQDFGWPVGFWHPCFIETFKIFFRHCAMIDDTHVFRYVGGMDEMMVDIFPDTPKAWPKDKYKGIYEDLTATAFKNNDTFSLFNFSLQLGSAYAAIGCEEEGEAIYNAAESLPFSAYKWCDIQNYKPSRQEVA